MFVNLLELVVCVWFFAADPDGPSDVPVFRCGWLT